MRIINKTHNWVLKEGERGHPAWWECSACKISDDDLLAQQRCLRFNILVHLSRRVVQFRKDMFHKAGMFLLRFSR